MNEPILLSHQFDPTLVEKDSPDSPPKAFRLWKAGENQYDGGTLFFTKRSADLLMAEQSKRGRLYPFDWNHQSLTSDAPTAALAAGWHSLEARGPEEEPELWIVGCEWVAMAEEGLTAKVPSLRYFSPAFGLDPDTNEVVSYTNTAICANPRTHALPSLAAHAGTELHKHSDVSGGSRSTHLDPKAALAVLADPNSTPEDRAAAFAVLEDLIASAASADPAPEMNSEQPPPEDPEKKEDAAGIRLAKENVDLRKKLDALEVATLLSTRGLSSANKAWLQTQPLATVKSFLASNTDFRPPPDANRNATPTVAEPPKAGFQPPAVGSSPVDVILGMRAPDNSKVGFAPYDATLGGRVLKTTTPSAARKAGS